MCRGLLGLLGVALLIHASYSATPPPLATSSSPDTLPPTITSVNALSSYVIRLAWAPVKATPPIHAYTVEYKPGHGGAWSRLPPTHLYTLTVGNLLPHTTYDLRVFASDLRGEGVPSPIISTTTPARVPTIPEVTDIVTQSPTEVLIKWKPPIEPKGVVIQYIVYYSPTHQQGEVPLVKVVGGHAAMVTISGLDPYTEYDFNITATTSHLSPVVRHGREGPMSTTNSTTTTTTTTINVLAVGVGAGVGGGAVLLLVVIIITVVLCCKFCCCVKSQTASFVRTSSVRMSTTMTKRKAVDPTDEFRAQSMTEALNNHPPLNVAEFVDRLGVMKTNDNQLFLEEFGAIPMTFPHPCETSERQENKDRNRFNNIPAYDYNRFILQEGLNTDYINANYCDGYMAKSTYIATQGPLPETVGDFWQMVWEADAHTIVMLTNVQEKGKPKCAVYWPANVGAAVTYGNIEVTLSNVTQLADYTTRSFVINKIGFGRVEPHDVCQFHFTSWPDQGVPQYATALLAMCRRVRTYHPNRGPIVVHCSAGVGRTGTYMAIDTMVERLKHEETTLDIFGYVTLLRTQRNYMVQTEDQYFFIHEAVAEAIMCGQTEVTVHDLASYMADLHKASDTSDTTRIEVEFKRLLIDKTDAFRYASARKDINAQKNRFVNVLPYETNRVYLDYIRATEGSDYINASYVDSYRKQKAFIATQSPLGRTVGDFWRMVKKFKCAVIIMLTELVEKGQERCVLYWPREIGSPRTFGNLTVELTKQNPSPTYTHREFTLTDTETGQRHMVHHFQYHGWPEQGVPVSGHGFIHFIQEVRNFYGSLNVTSPVVVHCSNGAGRTGVFIAMHIILERMLVEGRVDVFQTVKSLRIQRPAMVQTVDQYAFCYDIAIDFVESSGLLKQPPPTEPRARGNSSASELRKKNPSRSSILVPRGETYTRRSSVRLAPSTSQLHNVEDPPPITPTLDVTSPLLDTTPSHASRLSAVPEVVVIGEDGSRQSSVPDMGVSGADTSMLLSPHNTLTLTLDLSSNSSEA